MKAIDQPKTQNVRNAWGRYNDVTTQHFQVEEQDVNMQRDNWKGHRHARYQFRREDVGRVITCYSDGTGWNCWEFSIPPMEQP